MAQDPSRAFNLVAHKPVKPVGTYVVDQLKGWSHSGHVTLQRRERSRLADHAAEIL